jgi:hypothetical protein
MSQTELWSYVSALVLTATAFITFYRDRHKYKKWQRRLLVILIFGAGAVSCVLVHQSEKSAREAETRSGDQIAKLDQAVKSEKDDNARNYDRYTAQFNSLNDKINNLKTQVRTEKLQKELEDTQKELQANQKAMAPGPKARIEFSFYDLSALRTDTDVTNTVARVTENVAEVDFIVLNRTDVNAGAGRFWIIICDQCKFNSEPPGAVKVPGSPEQERMFSFDGMLNHVHSQTSKLQIEVPPNASLTQISFRYACTNCESEAYKYFNIGLIR